MKRAERHHLKQDELVNWLERASLWYSENQRNVVNVTLVVVGAALLLGGLFIYRTRQAERARALYGDALDLYHAPIGEEASQDGGPHFATAEERYRTALQAFERVADEYSSYDSGRRARYYAGLSQAALREYEAAERALSEVRSGERDLLHYLSAKALAAVKTERGDYSGAAEIYRSLVEDADNPLPKDHLLFDLARVEERAGNVEQARLYYDRMVAEHPDSQLRGDAITRSEVLSIRTEASGG